MIQNDIRGIDIIAAFALFIGLLNVDENRKQTASNDIHRENAAQLKEINARFDRLESALLGGINEDNRSSGTPD